MNKYLNRIERKIVIEYFFRYSRIFYIIINKSIFHIERDSYRSESNGRICFDLFENLLPGEAQIVFEYKNRPVFCFSDIEIQNNIAFFYFSEYIYKYDKNNYNKEVIINLCCNNTIVSLYTHDEFPLDSFVNDTHNYLKQNIPIDNVSLNLLKLKNRYNDIIIHRLYSFLVYFYALKQNDIFLNSGILFFIDDSIMCICVDTALSDIILNYKNLDICVEMKKRIIKVKEANVLTFFETSKTNSVLILSLDNAKTEDKRFLYEAVYKLKYMENKKSRTT